MVDCFIWSSLYTVYINIIAPRSFDKVVDQNLPLFFTPPPLIFHWANYTLTKLPPIFQSALLTTPLIFYFAPISYWAIYTLNKTSLLFFILSLFFNLHL